MYKWYEVAPIPIKRRVRFTKYGKPFIDQKTKDDLKRVADAYNGPLFEGPIGLIVYIYKPLPQAKRFAIPFVQKPDGDNVIKAVLDGLNGKAFLDDAQVIHMQAQKLPRVSHSERERIIFTVFSMEANDDETN